ncbi:23S rRNA accumulation protein YceD [Aurantivibrio plasticivorans]
MSEAPKLQALPRWVDARKFAYQGVEMEGFIARDQLSRLADAVVQVVQPVHAKLQFSVDDSRHRIVSGEVNVEVEVTCQRCMESVPLSIQGQLLVGVVASEDEAKQLPRDIEPWLLADVEGNCDLYEVIEDELLLDLPMVSYHDYQCIDDSLYSSGDEVVEEKAEEKPSPFDVLKNLKNTTDS